MSKDPRDNASGPGDPGSAGGEWWDVDSASGAGRDGTAGDAAGAEGDSVVRGGRRDAGDPGARDYGAGDGDAGSYDAGDYDAEDDLDDDVEDEVDDERGGRRGIWAWLAVAAVLGETEDEAYHRMLGAVAVGNLLLVALQPVLRRGGAPAETFVLTLVTDEGERVERRVEGRDFAAAVERSLRELERSGRTVRSLERR